MKILRRQAFQKHFQHKFSLRLHMLAILLATTLSGVLFSKLLLLFSIADFRIRYPLSILASYVIFFFCIKLWFYCISPNKSGKKNALDWIDFPAPSGRVPAEGDSRHFAVAEVSFPALELPVS
jgi:hypothetical protein